MNGVDLNNRNLNPSSLKMYGLKSYELQFLISDTCETNEGQKNDYVLDL